MTDIIPEHRRLPFDAEKAKRGEAVCTARGMPMQVRYEPSAFSFLDVKYGDKPGCRWTEAGKFLIDGGSPHQFDLRMVAEATTPTHVDPSTLVPFDEERARKGDQVYSDSGVPVTILRYELRNRSSFAVLVHALDGDYCGMYHASHLRMLPKQKEQVWVVLCGDPSSQRWRIIPGVCNTRKRAVQHAKDNSLKYIARCEIEEIE